MEMESQRSPTALQFQGTFRQGETVELPGSLIIGSDPACHLVLPASLPAEPLAWQILAGDQAVAVRNWSGQGQLNGSPFADAVLQPGDRLQWGELAVTLVPTERTPASTPTLPQTQREALPAPSQPEASLPEAPLTTAAISYAEKPTSDASASTESREREWLRRRLHSLALQVRKNQHESRMALQEQKSLRPDWVDDLLRDQRIALDALRDDVTDTRARIAELESRWDQQQSVVSPPEAPPASLSANLGLNALPLSASPFAALLQSRHFAPQIWRDDLTFAEAIELVAHRLDELQAERDDFEQLCHALTAKVGSLESDLAQQSQQLRDLRDDLTTAVTELKSLRTQMETSEAQASLRADTAFAQAQAAQAQAVEAQSFATAAEVRAAEAEARAAAQEARAQEAETRLTTAQTWAAEAEIRAAEAESQLLQQSARANRTSPDVPRVDSEVVPTKITPLSAQPQPSLLDLAQFEAAPLEAAQLEAVHENVTHLAPVDLDEVDPFDEFDNEPLLPLSVRETMISARSASTTAVPGPAPSTVAVSAEAPPAAIRGPSNPGAAPVVREVELHRLPVAQSADLQSLIQDMEDEVDEYLQYSGPSDSVPYVPRGDATTRSFIEDARLLPELPALEEEAHDGWQADDLQDEEQDWQASTVISASDDMSRTMIVDVPLDESGPLEPLGLATHSVASSVARESSPGYDAELEEAYESELAARLVAAVEEAPEFYAPSEAPPVSAASILGAMGSLPDDFQEGPAAVAVSTYDRYAAKPASEEDASIAQYMEQLLQRLGGATQAAQSAFAPAAPPQPNTSGKRSSSSSAPREATRQAAAPALQHPATDGYEASHHDTDHDEEPQTLASHDYSDSDMISLDMGDGMRRRSVPPEFSSDLLAMRELANISARSAIDRHVKQRWGYAALGKLTVCFAAMVTGLGLTLVSKSWTSIATWGAGASFVIATFWGFQAMQLFRLVAAAQQEAQRAREQAQRDDLPVEQA